jgi:hypothetical protein
MADPECEILPDGQPKAVVQTSGWPEAFLALQQGTVDALERTPWSSLVFAKSEPQ